MIMSSLGDKEVIFVDLEPEEVEETIDGVIEPEHEVDGTEVE